MWVAERDGEIVAHAGTQLRERVPDLLRRKVFQQARVDVSDAEGAGHVRDGALLLLLRGGELRVQSLDEPALLAERALLLLQLRRRLPRARTPRENR